MGDGIDTVLTIARALAGWILLAGIVFGILTAAVIAGVTLAVRALRRRYNGPQTPHHRHPARAGAEHRPRPSRRRTRPRWADTQPLDYTEAA